jgi:hypothetical protein
MTDQANGKAKAVFRPVSFVSGLQIRAGRALLGWRRTDLARAANLHPNAVAYWERRERLPRREEVGCRRIGEALSQAGVVAVNVPAPGVCLFPRSARPAPSLDAPPPAPSETLLAVVPYVPMMNPAGLPAPEPQPDTTGGCLAFPG